MRAVDQAEEIVSLLADICDIVLVSMHGGGEGSDFSMLHENVRLF
jgi:hypothetical protein